MSSNLLRFRKLPEKPDAIAPDGSEIRLLPELQSGVASMARCRLLSGQVSKAILHKSVEEVWYFTSGAGEVWRAVDSHESVTPVRAGDSLNVPLGTRFQFRNTGVNALEFIIVTAPPWPSEDEARPEENYRPTA